MKRHLDILLGSAGSLYSLFQRMEDEVMRYGPGLLTMIFIGMKIYYKVKRERRRERDQAHGRPWEDDD